MAAIIEVVMPGFGNGVLTGRSWDLAVQFAAQLKSLPDGYDKSSHYSLEVVVASNAVGLLFRDAAARNSILHTVALTEKNHSGLFDAFDACAVALLNQHTRPELLQMISDDGCSLLGDHLTAIGLKTPAVQKILFLTSLAAQPLQSPFF